MAVQWWDPIGLSGNRLTLQQRVEVCGPWSLGPEVCLRLINRVMRRNDRTQTAPASRCPEESALSVLNPELNDPNLNPKPAEPNSPKRLLRCDEAPPHPALQRGPASPAGQGWRLCTVNSLGLIAVVLAGPRSELRRVFGIFFEPLYIQVHGSTSQKTAGTLVDLSLC